MGGMMRVQAVLQQEQLLRVLSTALFLVSGRYKGVRTLGSMNTQSHELMQLDT